MEELVRALNEKSNDGKILCKDALEIAGTLQISPAEVGKKINEMKIKIKGCQLGCFK